ncbi:MAG TPA: molybdopterin molybdenumtransferase MoeA, partial [Usitatibacteraceae bacterium]|nr:molybdopterin molybdenumtransferase MoeA [Usitatibacteraceae bacterium]
MTKPSFAEASCADDYDPNSMPVDKARAFIHRFLEPVTAMLRVPIRDALGRVLAEDVLSPVDVPAHRNSAMDGWAIRGADLTADGSGTFEEIGTSFAGHPFAGTVGAGQCVRIMTGGVVPEGADTVVMQERAAADGKRIAVAPGQKTGQNVRHAGEDLAKGSVALPAGRLVRPADL